MKKLRWLKEWKERKPGDISNAGKKSAENFVSQGFAEYIDEEKVVKNKIKKEVVTPKIEEQPKTQVQKWREEQAAQKEQPKEEEKKTISEEEIIKRLDNISELGPVQKEIKLKELSKETNVTLNTLKKQLDEIEGKKVVPKQIVEVSDKELEQLKMLKELNKQIGYGHVKSHLENLDERKSIVENLGRVIYQFFDFQDLARQMLCHQPIIYDKGKNWWIWNWDTYKWVLVDDVDILRKVEYCARINTTSSKIKNEVIDALKQAARGYEIQQLKPTWIQFKNKVIDIETNEELTACPKYFLTNPIPWELGKSDATPNMDRIFEEWVGKDYVQTLYEILAYCLIPSYPVNRIFCFYGSGMNGKSKYLDLLRKFVGDSNCTSTELDILTRSRFELVRLHKKLVCQMGETNFEELKGTSTLKKLTGGDLIGFEYKGGKHFEDVNYAKIIISTNNLPQSDDKSIGFYRRWMIIDFPNQFTEKKDILEDIPEIEYSNLARKCINILKGLLVKREFTNEGSIEERKDKFESKSDFLQKFINDFVEENFNGYITVNDFKKKFADWCRENRHREMSDTTLSQHLKKKGWEQERKYMDWLFDGKGGNMRVWLDKKWK